uniref:Ubiquitin-like-conjugating enzyme ATG3 n=1 Tax=Globodera rostochiensis TaxID=31243 RepID=A0A914I7L4_GLORO
MNVNDLVNQFKSAALTVGEYLTPVLRESKFRETGVLTPEEFVAAGDHLVHLCPTWSWSDASDPTRVRDYLPIGKQFLISRRVPCHHRCSQMSYNESLEKIIREEGSVDGDEWVDTHHFDTQTNLAPKELDDELEPANTEFYGGKREADESGEEGEAFDLDEYIGSGGLEGEDPHRYVAKPRKNSPERAERSDEVGILRTRTYDLHITYDKYYQVPRFWLVGYDEDGTPLTVDQMKDDFSQDHKDRTITLETHPHVANLSLATIHPCHHASVMKHLIEQFLENGRELNVLDYLFIFLKFVQAVIPTVEYDYTRSIRF